MRNVQALEPQEQRPRDGTPSAGDLQPRPEVGIPSPAVNVPKAPGGKRGGGAGAAEVASWPALLSGGIQLPQWSGPSNLFLKLSDGDKDDVEEVEPYKVPTHWRCSQCRLVLPLTKDNFYRNRREKTGFLNECKECHSARQGIRRNPAKHLQGA